MNTHRKEFIDQGFWVFTHNGESVAIRYDSNTGNFVWEESNVEELIRKALEQGTIVEST